jgi:hypothetical protein
VANYSAETSSAPSNGSMRLSMIVPRGEFLLNIAANGVSRGSKESAPRHNRPIPEQENGHSLADYLPIAKTELLFTQLCTGICGS